MRSVENEECGKYIKEKDIKAYSWLACDVIIFFNPKLKSH